MFDRFTDRARKVMALARKAALAMGHEFVGARHILLGCLEEGTGVAANALKNLDATLPRLREAVESRGGGGPSISSQVSIPFSARAKDTLEGALQEAAALGHNYVGTEHLLLGLLRDPQGAASECLRDLGLGLDVLRNEVFILLGAHAPEGPETST